MLYSEQRDPGKGQHICFFISLRFTHPLFPTLRFELVQHSQRYTKGVYICDRNLRMASSTVSSWLIGSCMSLEHELDGWLLPSRKTKGVFINSKSNNALTFSTSSSFFSHPNRTPFSSSNSFLLLSRSVNPPPRTKIISSAQTGKLSLYA